MSSPRRGSAVLLLVPLALSAPQLLAAQVTWAGHLGATYTGTMVTDFLVGTIKLAPGISPTLNIQASMPLKTKTPLDGSIELQATTGTLRRKEGGTTTDLASMRTIALTAGIGGRMLGPVQWRAGAGFLSYVTSEKASIFQQGAPTRLTGTVGLQYRRRLNDRYALSGLVRYDVHSFTTKQLESNGYTGTQLVHRLTAGIGVSR